MIVYIIMLFISVVLLIVAEKVEKKALKITLYILAVLPFFIVSALRYNVGTDYLKRYVADFNKMVQGKDIKNLEIGFKLIIRFCLIFTKNPNLLFILTSGIIIVLIMTTIYTKSKNVILSVLIFFLGGFFFGSLNIVRQYIAISIILFGYRFLIKEQYSKNYDFVFVICVLLATLIHSSSIVCIILVLLNKKGINIKWVVPISIIIILLGENIMNVLTIIIEKTRFSVYLKGNFAKGEISILNILVNLIIYTYMYAIYHIKAKNNEKITKEATLFLNIQGIALIITALGACHMLFSRIALYFVAFQILSIPSFISIMPLNRITETIHNKLNINIKEKTIKITTITFVLVCFSIMFCYTNILNNDNEVLPYQTIFTINKKK